MKTTYVIAIVAIAILVGAVAAYVFLSQPSSNPETSVSLNGAGATFPQPFLNATIQAYHSIKPNVQINYQGGGSGAGINALTQKTVDFAATDAPLTDSQRAKQLQTFSIFLKPSAQSHLPIICQAFPALYS